MPFTAAISADLKRSKKKAGTMKLCEFCSEMKLSEEGALLLKPHWEKILNAWEEETSFFVSESYLKKYLPLLKTPDEAEIMRRGKEVIALCEENKAPALYMFVLYYCTFKLKLQVNPVLATSFWGENEGIAALIAALSCAPLIEENCREKQIPLHYAADVLQWIGGTVDIYKLSHNGIPGHSLQQLFWLRRHVDGELYRIGRFEYLIHRLPDWMPLVFRNDDGVLAVLAAPGLKLDARGLVTLKDDAVAESFIEEEGALITGLPCAPDGSVRVNETLTVDRRAFKPVCAPWDIVPSIHIPGGLRMGWEDALNSMKEAKEFFCRYLKREVPMFVCCSWILNPAFEKFAPNGNMARFRRELFCVPTSRWGSDGRDGMFFSFGRSDADPTAFEPVNSLQKLLQTIFRAEGTLRTGGMFVLSEDLDKLGDMYYRTKQKVL